jgi:hypothetical protein
MLRGQIRVALLVLAAAWLPPSAAGQTTGSVFAPGETRPPRTPPDEPKRLDLNLSVHEAVDSTTLSDRVLSVDPVFRHSTGFTAATASLRFSNSSRGVKFGALGASNVRYFTPAAKSLRADYYGALNVTAPFSNRLTGQASQRISYSPYYVFGDLLQADEVEPDQVLLTDQGTVPFATYRARTSANLAWKPAARTTIDTRYMLEVVDTTDRMSGAFTQGGNMGLRQRLTEYADLRLGYGYRHSQVGSALRAFDTHDLATGFSYGRPLSSSRRTFVAFDTGASLVVRQTRAFFLTGNASLTHQMSRTWATGLTYRRSVSAYAGVSDPYLVDAVSGRLGGRLTRRLMLNVSADVSRGRVAVDIVNGYTSSYGRARLLYSVNRYLPIFGEYVYYHYRFDRAVGLAAGFPTFVTRHGVRGGLYYSMPLVGRRAPS